MKTDSQIDNPNFIKNQKGQSLIEFVLILLVVSGLSFTFLIAANTKISEIWVQMVNLVSDDNINQSDLR